VTADELIADSFCRLPHVSKDVRKAALLSIARVQTAIAPEVAVSTLMEGWAAGHGLSSRFDESFIYLTRLATAAVAPQRLSEVKTLPEPSALRSVVSESRVMRQHGHEEYLRDHLLHSGDVKNVSIEGLAGLLAEADDADEQQWLLRRMVHAWRAQTEIGVRRPWEAENIFLFLFRDYWPVLPRAEAAAVVEEMVCRIMSKRDESTFGSVQDLEFNSLQSLKLFQIYDLILELIPDAARQLVKKKRELGRAVKRYPKGHRSISEEVAGSRPPQEVSNVGSASSAAAMFGSKADRWYALALLAAQRTKDFRDAVQSARAAYTHDNGPNRKNCAPKAFWPSTAMYRTIFHAIGRAEMDNGDEHLANIPDAELRLLAQIELAAGLSALPELTWTTQRLPC
jgi:hypothetical protein